jgi:hypothetical protein
MGSSQRHSGRHLQGVFHHPRANDDFAAWFCEEDTENAGKRTSNGKKPFERIQEDEQIKGLGQDFEEFMVEQGVYDEAKEIAAKKLIAHALRREMERQNLSKTFVAKQMRTSRAAIDNILDTAYNTSIGTLERFAGVLGKRLSISLR